MAAKIGVLITHGIGKTKPGFSDDLVEALGKRLRKIGVPLGDIAFHEIYWQDIIQSKQSFYIEEAKGTRLDGKVLRGFFMNFLADATMYQQLPNNVEGDSIYEQIHERVHGEVVALEQQVDPNAALIMMAHSMGGHILSNYVWDRQQNWVGRDEPIPDDLGGTDFQRMKSLASFMTFGCNIPLFAMATDPYRPIRVPSPSDLIPQNWNATNKWLNFYDRDDVLGWPLQPLAADEDEDGVFIMPPEDRPPFREMVADIPIDVGWWLIQNWNPLSHLGYWDDSDFIKPVAEHMKELHTVI